jgi:hypothetical protein
LCYALGIPLISVDTLQVLAKKVVVKDGLIVPMLDARRMEVYSAIFDKSYSKIKGVQAEILTENSYAEITDTIYFIGDCQDKCQTVLKGNNFHFHSEIVYFLNIANTNGKIKNTIKTGFKRLNSIKNRGITLPFRRMSTETSTFDNLVSILLVTTFSKTILYRRIINILLILMTVSSQRL